MLVEIKVFFAIFGVLYIECVLYFLQQIIEKLICFHVRYMSKYVHFYRKDKIWGFSDDYESKNGLIKRAKV